MRTRQAQQLEADVMALLDEVGSVKPASADLLESLNERWCDVYAKLIQAGINWNLQTSKFTTTAGQDSYGSADGAFGATYWKTAGVDVQSGGWWRNAERAEFERRNDYQNGTWSWPFKALYDVWGGTADAAGTDGTVLKFITPPTSGNSVRHYWFPAPQRLVNPTDVFDGIAGAERVIVYGAAQEMAYLLEQYEQGDRWGQLADKKLAQMISVLRDRNTGDAPVARVVRGRPSAVGRRIGSWWRG